jgi:hypothetical protein
MRLKLTIFLLLLVIPSTGHAKGNFYDFMVGGTIKNLAKVYVKTTNLGKLKEKYKKVVLNMKPERFKKNFMKFFKVYKQLPPELQKDYVFTENTTKADVIALIDKTSKRDIIKIINKIPSDFIVDQTRHYSPPPQGSNLPQSQPPQVNEMFLWKRIMQKV